MLAGPHANIESIADAALYRPQGITADFDAADFITVDACKKAAVTLRNSFYTLKVKVRRQFRKATGNPLAQGAYDSLSCFIDETPKGWRLTLVKAAVVKAHIADAETGEPIRELTPEFGRWEAIRRKVFDEGYHQPKSPIEGKEEEEYFFSFDPEMSRTIYKDRGWTLPEERLEKPPSQPSKWDKYVQPEGN